MRYLVIIVLLLVFNFTLFGQYSLQGVVTNEKGELLSFTTVFFENSKFAAATDEKGRYLIENIPAGTYDLKATFIGYQAYKETISLDRDVIKNIQLKGEIYNLDLIEIQANRVADNGPFSKQNLIKQVLQKENLGQDIPFILQWTPSMVVTSDAGNGIGYTGLRLRGSDQTRVNVTLNGVPVNDAESHNVFWVDLPDLMGSVNNIQIQRGVGTSTNGTGAFGGTVSVNTVDMHVNPYIDINGTLGSFNTRKLSLNVGTGLLNDRYVVDARFSIIKSDGYLDRASADLNSMFFSAARVTAKSSLRLNIISGKEITYQAWYGTPQSKVDGDQTGLLNHYYNNLGSIYRSVQDSINLFSSDRRYNYYTYPNQVDNYRQTHIQLIHSLTPNARWKTKSTAYYTKGKGYFEEFKFEDKLADYAFPILNDSLGNEIEYSDIVRRRWLNNDLIGLLLDAEFHANARWTYQAGLSANTYIGRHFGNVIRYDSALPKLDKTRNYYENEGNKTEAAAYMRAIFEWNKKITVHGDIQARNVKYDVNGIDNDLRKIDVGYSAFFINPKLGITYQSNMNHQWYASIAVGNKEPSRGDFIDNAFSILPKSEHLQNYEVGYRYQKNKTRWESNVYFMDYSNQLVLTGELNDVGAPVRVNVPESYRLGWENSITHQLTNKLAIHTNATISSNKIAAFKEIIADYTIDFDKVTINHNDTDISFSPSLTGAFQILYQPIKNMEVEWSLKYVSKQYLDNTQNNERSLPSYSYQNLRLGYAISSEYWKYFGLTLMVNNLFDQRYSSNGYTYSYIYGETITENFVYPQAGLNLMLGVKIGL